MQQTTRSEGEDAVLQPPKLFLRPSVLRFAGPCDDKSNESSNNKQPAEPVTKSTFAFVSLDKKPFEPKTELPPHKPELTPHKKPTLRRTDSQTTDEDPDEGEKPVEDAVSNGCSESNKTDAPSTSCGTSSSTLTTSNLTTTSFVFGEKLDARAVVKPKTDDENSADSIKDAASPENRENSKDTGGDSSSLASPHASASSTKCRSPSGDKKRKYEAITGEEDELNVMQIHAKLYQFNTDDSTWKEKGRGPLRLNDRVEASNIVASRLIMRTGGTLGVILNTPIVTGMIFQRDSNFMRFGCADGIYGIRGKANEIERLHNAIECRLSESQKRLRVEDENAPEDPEEETETS